MKGQTFLLTAGILIAVLVALRGFATVSQISSEREILDVSLEDLIFKNIDSEVRQITVVSSSEPRNVTNNAIDFLNFTRVGTGGRSLDFRSLFVGILANSTNETMNITVFQFLRETDLNVTIQLNSSTAQRNSTFLNDSGIWMNNFSFTAGQHYNLTISLPGRGYQENVTIKTRGSTDTYAGYFDIRLHSIRAVHVDKFQQEVRIS